MPSKKWRIEYAESSAYQGSRCDLGQHDHQVNRLYCQLPDSDRPLVFDPTCLTPAIDDQSCLRIILIGYPEDVNREILNLYYCGYDIAAWSPPQQIPGTVEVITVYTKRSRRLSHG